VFAACGIMHRRCCLLVTPADGFFGALYHKLQTQSSAPEDGRKYRPKHVELIEITNKLLLLHLVGCLHYCIRYARSHKHQRGSVFSATHALTYPPGSMKCREFVYGWKSNSFVK